MERMMILRALRLLFAMLACCMVCLAGEPHVKDEEREAKIGELLGHLASALTSQDSKTYAKCFSESYLKDTFGGADDRDIRIRDFLREHGATSCSYKDISVSPVPGKSGFYRTKACRRMKTRTAPSEGAGEIALLANLPEFYRDVLVVDMTRIEQPRIVELASTKNDDKQQEYCKDMVAELDQEIGKLGGDATDKKCMLLLEKAYYLDVGLGQVVEAESALRDSLRLSEPDGLATLALAAFLHKHDRAMEALTFYRKVAAGMQAGSPLQRDLERLIGECEREAHNEDRNKTRIEGGVE